MATSQLSTSRVAVHAPAPVPSSGAAVSLENGHEKAVSSTPEGAAHAMSRASIPISVVAAALAGCSAERSAFTVGVNYPWHRYGIDFGETAWGAHGVDHSYSRVEDDLRALSGAGVEAVRWFLFADGRAAPDFSADGTPTGLSESFYRDLDAALSIADDADIQILFVLLDYCWGLPAESSDGVQMFGRGEVLSDARQRAALEDAVLRPLLQHVGDHPAVLGWEVMNEPEWILDDLPEADTAIDDIVAVIRAESALPVTVGSASRQELERRWLGRGLDWLQLHAYTDPLLLPDAAEISADAPILIGEFATAWEDEAAVLDHAWASGYSGAWGWSFRAEDDASDLDLDALAGWAP